MRPENVPVYCLEKFPGCGSGRDDIEEPRKYYDRINELLKRVREREHIHVRKTKPYTTAARRQTFP